mmetsp:Transcript_7540/g.20076  ORF Transcript_7540/g.20076 Transcript_7540/m.20076 type:complete len:311 (-) Transcript_7540:1116-2048(-)
MEDTRSRWQRAYLEAMDYDIWGQVEEAIEGWQRLQVASAAEYVENVLQLPMNRRDGIGKLAGALKCRIQELQTGTDQGVGVKGIKAIKPFMSQLIITDEPFPSLGGAFKGEKVLDVAPSYNEDPEPLSETEVTQEEPDSRLEESTETSSSNKDNNGTLRGRPQNLQPRDTVLRITVQKWGFKDATLFQQPRVVVSVRDEQGEVLEAVQETPVSKGGTHQYIFFDTTVYLQTAINRLPSGSAIFFEFKHWKEKEKKKSCKAYSFLEMDELKDGPAMLEAYKKPPNFKRNKQPSLLTTKPLYLHLHLTLERH